MTLGQGRFKSSLSKLEHKLEFTVIVSANSATKPFSFEVDLTVILDESLNFSEALAYFLRIFSISRQMVLLES